MKRSKVVEVLASWAKPEILNEVYNNNTEEWANNLLHTLTEELGMFPPTLTGITKVEVDEETGEMFIKLWGWEAEDPTEEELQDQGKRSGAV